MIEIPRPNKKIIKGYNDLEHLKPELMKEWDFEKNNIKPSEVSCGSNKKAWWIFSSNIWFSEVYGGKLYLLLVQYFNQYRKDMMLSGKSDVFNGVHSVQDLKQMCGDL